eukprot:TRINITY_DN2427_c0_g1_i1.p1 TRINITY_DN2427_c0_g1~~TRINITY_DN2427_c0_g1_i1.p1  ORF type:complete len:239 (+),score=72.35 TRINITY_DN2427_c0_g1_i1:77-793(+)
MTNIKKSPEIEKIYEQINETADNALTKVIPKHIIDLTVLYKKVCEEQGLFNSEQLNSAIDSKLFPKDKTRTSSNFETTSSVLKSNYCPNEIPINPIIAELTQSVKTEIFEFVEVLADVKTWIQLLVPPLDHGDNFGAAVQTTVLQELASSEDNAFELLEHMTKYHITRSKLISKAYKYPKILDYQQAVFELDEKHFIQLRLASTDLRNNYLLIYDLLMKNIEKIKKPKVIDQSMPHYL